MRNKRVSALAIASLLAAGSLTHCSSPPSSPPPQAQPSPAPAPRTAEVWAPSQPPPPVIDPAVTAAREAAELFQYGQTAEAKKDIRKAVDLYEKACSGGENMGCAMAGYWYVEGRKGVPKNYAKAFALLTKACSANLAMACNNLGVSYSLGRAVPRDWGQAASFFGKACQLGQQGGCDNLKVARWNIAVDATGIWRAYNANEVAADNKFKGKRFTVVGLLQTVTKDFTDAIILDLRSPNPFMPTRAYLSASEAATAATLRKGQKMLLTCTCTGMMVGSPVLKDCAIEDSATVPRNDDDDDDG